MPPELLKIVAGTSDAEPLANEVLSFLGAKFPTEIQPSLQPSNFKHLSAAELFRRRYISHEKFLSSSDRRNNWQLSPAYIATNQTNESRCNGCGTCLIGCHTDVPFNSTDVVDKLLKKYPSFKYLNKKKCVYVSESESDAIATCVDSTNKLNGFFQFKAKKIILAAGPLSTATIIANSLNLTKKLNLQHRNYYHLA